jgi:tripartite-type tricarboxylate transporter receptor subunit TctC
MKKSFVFALAFLMLAAFGYAGGNKEESAADYPSRTITLAIGAAPGGTLDTNVRLLGPYLSQELGGVTVNIVNIAGAAGWTALNDCLASAPDGYKLYATSQVNLFMGHNAAMNNKTRPTDFQYLANMVTDPNVLYVNKTNKVQTFQEFLDYCTANKDVIIGTTAVAGNHHVCYIKLASVFPAIMQNTKPLMPSDAAEMVTNQLGGFSDFMIANVGTYATVKDSCNAICVFGDKRSQLLPDVPTFNELAKQMGLNASIVNGSFRGIIMNKGGNPAVIEKITAALERAMTKPDYKQKMADNSLEWYGIFGPAYEKFVLDDEQDFIKLLPLLGWK